MKAIKWVMGIVVTLAIASLFVHYSVNSVNESYREAHGLNTPTPRATTTPQTTPTSDPRVIQTQIAERAEEIEVELTRSAQEEDPFNTKGFFEYDEEVLIEKDSYSVELMQQFETCSNWASQYCDNVRNEYARCVRESRCPRTDQNHPKWEDFWQGIQLP